MGHNRRAQTLYPGQKHIHGHYCVPAEGGPVVCESKVAPTCRATYTEFKRRKHSTSAWLQGMKRPKPAGWGRIEGHWSIMCSWNNEGKINMKILELNKSKSQQGEKSGSLLYIAHVYNLHRSSVVKGPGKCNAEFSEIWTRDTFNVDKVWINWQLLLCSSGCWDLST